MILSCLQLEKLIAKLETLDSPVVFSHNDLLYGNIIYDDEKGEVAQKMVIARDDIWLRDTEEAAFIDYEYGSYAFRGFDLGNHFNEFAGFECDYSRYPTKDFQMQWFDWYLTEYNGGMGEYHKGGAVRKLTNRMSVEPTQAEKDHLYKEVEGFSLASHFYWGLWALIQAKVSDIDFDYMSYAVLRFDEYERRKQIVFPESF